MKDFYYKPPDYRHSKFLTKRSSWFKLVIFICLLVIMIWGVGALTKLALTRLGNIRASAGKIAGATTSSQEPKPSSQNYKTKLAPPSQDKQAPEDRVRGSQGSPPSPPSEQKKASAPDTKKPSSAKTAGSAPAYHLRKPKPIPPSSETLKQLTPAERVLASATNGYTLAKIAKKRLAEGEYDLAVKGFERVTKLEPYWRDGWYLLALTLAYRWREEPVKPANDLSDLEKSHLAVYRALAIDPLDKKSQELDKIIKSALEKQK